MSHPWSFAIWSFTRKGYTIDPIIYLKLKIMLNFTHDYITWVAHSCVRSVTGLNCRANCHPSRHATQILMSKSKFIFAFYHCRLGSKPKVIYCAALVQTETTVMNLKKIYSLLPNSLPLCSSFVLVTIVFESPWSGIFQVGLGIHLLNCLPIRIMLHFIFLILTDTKITKSCRNLYFNYLQSLMIYEFASVTIGLKYVHLKMLTIPIYACKYMQACVFFWLL